MKKVLLFVVVAFASIAPTFAQNSAQPQPGFQTVPYCVSTPQPQVIVRNYCPAPTVRVTNPEVTVPVTIQQLPPVAPVQNPDDFTGQQILSMILIAGLCILIGFIIGFFKGRSDGRSNGNQNQRPQIFHLHGGRGGDAVSFLSVENNE